MQSKASMADLEKFAKQKLDAHRYPNDHHNFRPAQCPDCGIMPVALEIEHHTGSTHDNFRGFIQCTCTNCDKPFLFLSFTGEHRKPESVDTPKCICGSFHFLVAEVERYEGDDGIPGFFDEGVVAGQCNQCSRHRVFVFTD